MSGLLVITLAIYVPLLIISLLFIRRAIKLKNKTRLLLLIIAIGFCAFRIGIAVKDELHFQKYQNRQKKLYYENFSNGDTATMTGWVLHRSYDDKETQDTVDKLNQDERLRSGRGIFSVAILPDGQKNWHMKIVETDLAGYDSLAKYMNFYKQLTDSITYKFTFTAIKYSDGERWKLLKVLNVDTVKELPKYWH